MQRFCEKCRGTMDEINFYTSNNLEKYPDAGRLNVCKKCLTLHVDNWNPETYLNILEELDVPYIPDEWNKIMQKHVGKKLNGTTIIGKYLSKMKLKQWREFRWKDSEELQQLAAAKLEQAMRKQGYTPIDIQKVLDEGMGVELPPKPVEVENISSNGFAPALEEDVDLTEEDITYLRLKWGNMYKPSEWVRMEQLYNEMMQSYDIQSAGHIDTLKLICKVSLKSNQLLDIGDIDGAQKATKMYDSLMKSGRFTAAQIKDQNGEYVDSISELVNMCEKEGFIPRYYTDGPKDKVDKVLLDTQQYVRNLVTEEMGLGTLIERAIRELQEEKEKINEARENGIDDDDDSDLFDYDKPLGESLTEDDLFEFNDQEEELSDQDQAYLQALLEGDEF